MGKVNNDNNIINLRAPTGTSADQAMNKLRDDAPGLHARVISGELSPHAAMIEAGFRPRKVSINMDSAESSFKTITGHMKADVLHELIDLHSSNPPLQCP